MSALDRQSDVTVDDLIASITVDRGIKIPADYGYLYARRQRDGSDRKGAFYATMVNLHGAFCWSRGVYGDTVRNFASRAVDSGRSLTLVSVREEWPNKATPYPGGIDSD